MPQHVCKPSQPLSSMGPAAGTGGVGEGSQGSSPARQRRFSKASCSPQPLAREWVRYVPPPIPVTIRGTRAANESFDYSSNLQRQQTMAQLSVTPLLPSSHGSSAPDPRRGTAGCQPCAVPDPHPGKDVSHPGKDVSHPGTDVSHPASAAAPVPQGACVARQV